MKFIVAALMAVAYAQDDEAIGELAGGAAIGEACDPKEGKEQCTEGLCCGKAYRKCDKGECTENKYPGWDKRMICNDK